MNGSWTEVLSVPSSTKLQDDPADWRVPASLLPTVTAPLHLESELSIGTPFESYSKVPAPAIIPIYNFDDETGK